MGGGFGLVYEPLVHALVPHTGWVTRKRRQATSAALILLRDYGDDLHEERAAVILRPLPLRVYSSPGVCTFN